MEPMKIIECLASRAREEHPPHVDVTGGVMQQIGDLRHVPLVSTRDLGWMAGVSAVAAAFLVFFAARVWGEMFDPVSSLFQPLFLMVP